MGDYLSAYMGIKSTSRAGLSCNSLGLRKKLSVVPRCDSYAPRQICNFFSIGFCVEELLESLRPIPGTISRKLTAKGSKPGVSMRMQVIQFPFRSDGLLGACLNAALI